MSVALPRSGCSGSHSSTYNQPPVQWEAAEIVQIFAQYVLWTFNISEHWFMNRVNTCKEQANCVEQSPSWEANRSSAGQEILCILRNSKSPYCI